MGAVNLDRASQAAIRHDINMCLHRDLISRWVRLYKATKHLDSPDVRAKGRTSRAGEATEDRLASHWLLSWVEVKDVVAIFNDYDMRNENLLTFLDNEVARRTADIERGDGDMYQMKKDLEEVKRLHGLAPSRGVMVLFKRLPDENDFVCQRLHKDARANLPVIARNMSDSTWAKEKQDQRDAVMFSCIKMLELMLSSLAFRDPGNIKTFNVKHVMKAVQKKLTWYVDKYVLPLTHEGLMLKEFFNPMTRSLGGVGLAFTFLPSLLHFADNIVTTLECMMDVAPKNDELLGRNHISKVISSVCDVFEVLDSKYAIFMREAYRKALNEGEVDKWNKKKKPPKVGVDRVKRKPKKRNTK